ncbi:major facilitator superfamily multidrug-resistance, DHA1 sub-family [Infundibulicybe gibba]|nr:major facilitator superfamily multidrug-resistance, DHA1 sub-family [Infundibulicybe gibba]
MMSELESNTTTGPDPVTHEINSDDRQAQSKRTPLPKLQLFIVNLIQFAEPVTATVIYPFINEFVRRTGVTHGDEKKTGYYAGVIESIFFLAEASTVFGWGRLSDRIGRRPVILLGPLGLSLAMLGFGLSHRFWSLVLFRCFQGIFNGNIGVSKSVIAEITDSTNIADVYAILPLVWSSGITIAPVIGGVLSNPATRWPNGIGKIEFLQEYPYFMPCATAGLVAFISFLISFMALKETLPTAIRGGVKRKNGQQVAFPTGEDTIGTTETLCETAPLLSQPSEGRVERPPTLGALLTPQILPILATYMFLTFTDMCNIVLRPLMFSTSIKFGGLGLSPYEIGNIMGVWGVINAAVQFTFLAKIIRRLGTRNTFIITYAGLMVVTISYPILGYYARKAGRIDAVSWIIIVVQLIFQMLTGMAYASNHIMIVENAPNRALLGSTNGLAQTLACSMRTLAPSLASSLFSISLEHNIAGGSMVYFVLVAVSLVGIRVSLFLPKNPR